MVQLQKYAEVYGRYKRLTATSKVVWPGGRYSFLFPATLVLPCKTALNATKLKIWLGNYKHWRSLAQCCFSPERQKTAQRSPLALTQMTSVNDEIEREKIHPIARGKTAKNWTFQWTNVLHKVKRNEWKIKVGKFNDLKSEKNQSY